MQPCISEWSYLPFDLDKTFKYVHSLTLCGGRKAVYRRIELLSQDRQSSILAVRRIHQVDRLGIEPKFSACKAEVLAIVTISPKFILHNNLPALPLVFCLESTAVYTVVPKKG